MGLPYFLLAATSPLVQAWFAQARPGENPYRLFAVSNLASLVALLGYPFLVEPFFSAGEQVAIWSWLFAAFALAFLDYNIVGSGAVDSESQMLWVRSVADRSEHRMLIGWVLVVMVVHGVLGAMRLAELRHAVGPSRLDVRRTTGTTPPQDSEQEPDRERRGHGENDGG